MIPYILFVECIYIQKVEFNKEVGHNLLTMFE